MYVYILCFNYIQKYKKPNRIENYKKEIKNLSWIVTELNLYVDIFKNVLFIIFNYSTSSTEDSEESQSLKSLSPIK